MFGQAGPPSLSPGAPWRCRRNDLPGERKTARDDDELPVPGPAHGEGLLIRSLKRSHDVRHRRAAIGLRRAPANDNAPADICGREADDESVLHHTSHYIARAAVGR